MIEQSKVKLIGVGNRFRRDDGVGWQIVQALRQTHLPETEALEASGEGASLIEFMQGGDTVLLFDAVVSGATPGAIFRFEAHNERIPTRFFNYSTHAFSVAEAIEMARALGKLPARLLVYGIEGDDFDGGVSLTPAVQAAIPRVIELVMLDLKSETTATANGIT